MNILLLGFSGLVGRNIIDFCKDKKDINIITSKCNGFGGRVDLTQPDDIYEFIWEQNKKKKIDCVINAAGSVGGINYNLSEPFKQIVDNATIGLNVVKACQQNDIPKLINLSSACTYAKTNKQ